MLSLILQIFSANSVHAKTHNSQRIGDIQYSFEENDYGISRALSFENENVIYDFVYGEDGRIIYIKSENGLVAKYTYDNSHVTVYSFVEGNWVENDDPNFIGNKNVIREFGFPIDEATGYSLIGNRLFDTISGRYVDGTNNPNLYTDVNPFAKSKKADASILSVSDSLKTALSWSSALMADSNHGRPLSYSSGWYNSLSDVELLSRCIYNEGGTAYITEDDAVAWVILNRYHSSSYPNTLMGVIKASGQFASVTGGSSAVSNSLVPATNSARWERATFLACLLLTSLNKTEWTSIVSNPIGNALNFYSYTTAKNKYNSGNCPFSGTSSSSLKYEGKLIKEVFVIGYGSVSSFSSLFSQYNPVVYSRNIYYNYR